MPTSATLTPAAAKSILSPFYTALTSPGTRDVEALLCSVLSPDWRSYGSAGTSKSRDEFIAQVRGFGKAIPDLQFAVQETLLAGDRAIVRSEATGTPAGEFMGVPHGGRSFKIMTIDIHTLKDGKAVAAFHVEDWATAMRQLSMK